MCIRDRHGRESGEYKVVYETPVKMRANISAATGEAQVEQFGSAILYDRVIISDERDCPIDEHSCLLYTSCKILSARTESNANANSR